MIVKLTNTLKNSIILFFLSMGLLSNAQFKVSGYIIDSTGSRVSFAAINLSADSSKIIRMSVSDSLGSFAFAGLPKGNYTLTANLIGAQLFSGRFHLANDTMLVVKVKFTSSILQDVIVTASKPLFERKIDRTVFNIGNSLAARGTDLATAIGLAPMLKVSENGISIIGKSSVAVMINERIVHLGGSDLINYLKSLRSDDVAKIEIITTPPAKYEAQGNSGLINIVLKRDLAQGIGGSISTSYAQRMYPGFGNNASLNFQSAKISASIKLRHYNRKGFIQEQNDIVGLNYAILSHDPRLTLATGIGANTSFEYKITNTGAIGFVYDEGSTNYELNLENTTTYQRNNATDSILQTLSHSKNPTETRTITLYYDQKLGSSGKKLTTDLNYFSNAPITNIDFTTLSDHSSNIQTVRTFSGIRYQIWSAQSDLILPYKWATVETGTKFTNFDNNSDVRYSDLVAQQYVIDHSKSNHFDYNEKNIAGYVSMQKVINKKWTGKAGFRYEYSIIEGYSPTTSSRNRSEYGKLFPTAYLTYKPGSTHTVSLSYSKRINRPNFRAINPFRYYTNPYTYSTGNPLLQPSLTHNIELTWLYKSYLSVTFYTQHLDNGFGYITQVIGTYKVVDAKNFLTQNSTGLTATSSIRFFKWWESSSHVTYSMSASSSTVADFITEKGSLFNLGTNHTFRISNKLTVFINYSKTLPGTQGNTYRAAQFDFSSGARMLALNNKLQFTASAALGAVDRSRSYFKDYTQYVYTDYNYRTANFSLTYIFGRSKVKGNTKKVDFKETQRTN